MDTVGVGIVLQGPPNSVAALQMEEFEDLQLELRAKDAQLREQRRVSKSLDIYQGENEVGAA